MAMRRIEHRYRIEYAGHGEGGYVYARCACGWIGPQRDNYTDTPNINARMDGEDHVHDAISAEAELPGGPACG